MDELLTLTECAKELGYKDTSTLRRAVKNKRLRADIKGKTYLVRRKDLEAYKAFISAIQTNDKRGWDKRGKQRKTAS